MSAYDEIDPTLSHWAVKNSLHWYSEYQDVEVRKLYLNPESKGRVHFSVDAPLRGQTVIRIGQLPRGLSRLARTANLPALVTDLASVLDQALKTANDWLDDEDKIGR